MQDSSPIPVVGLTAACKAVLVIILSVAAACSPPEDVAQEEPESGSGLSYRPNIVWLVAEDLGYYLPAFGDSTIVTPNLDRLAAESVRFTHVYSPSGVCAPSRAAVATGMYPTEIGGRWDVYTRALTIEPGDRVVAIAHRIGYKPS